MRCRPLPDAQQEPPVCHCGRCGGEIYREECAYLFEGKEICSDCLRTEIDRLLGRDLNSLAEMLQVDVVRYH